MTHGNRSCSTVVVPRSGYWKTCYSGREEQKYEQIVVTVVMRGREGDRGTIEVLKDSE